MLFSIPQRFAPWILAALCTGLVLHAVHYDFIADDTFITLRYADNLAAGHGLVFNPGDRVEGFTSMLWTVLLAALGFIGFDLLEAARFIGVLAAIIALVSTYWLARQCTEGAMIALLAPALLALNGSFACWAAAGMETPLFACLVVTAFAVSISGRYWTSAAVAVAALLTRPEGLLVFVVLGVYQIYRARQGVARPWLPWWLASGAAVVLLIAFRLWYFGDLLPNTYYAKTAAGWAQIERGLEYLGDYAADHEGVILLAAPVCIFVLRGASALRLLAAGVLAFWLAIVWLGGDGLPMYRFVVPSLPLFAVLSCALLDRLLRSAGARIDAVPRSGTVLVVLLVCAWAYVHLSPPRLKSHYGMYKFQREVEIPRWTRVGQWFGEHAAPGESIAVVPIGAVSFYSGLKVYDMLGLTDRHIARRQMPRLGTGWAGHEKSDGQYILKRKPTYLLLGNIDVSDKARDPRQRPFIPYDNANIWAREKDMFDGDFIFERYRPRSVQLTSGQYLNYYELKREFR
jgi:arabinofuranosyltransferase